MEIPLCTLNTIPSPNGDILVKEISEDRLRTSFRTLFEYMLQESADDINRPYNEPEREVVDYARRLLQKAENPWTSIRVHVGHGSAHDEFSLDDMIPDYIPKILQKMRVGIDGEEIDGLVLYLVIEDNTCSRQ